LHPGVRWPGEVAEFIRLLDCVGRHCTCRTSQECGAHQLLGAQRTVDNLVYARDVRQHFVDAEWTVDDEPIRTDTPHAVSRPAKSRRSSGKVALVAGAFAALALLMGLGGAWQASSHPLSAPQIGAWTSR
jgi:hypothetical protein